MKKQEDFVISSLNHPQKTTGLLALGALVAVFGLCAAVGYTSSVLAEGSDSVEFAISSSTGPVTGGQELDVMGSGLSDYESQASFSGQSVTIPAGSTIEEFVLAGETTQAGGGNPSPTNYRPFDTNNAYIDVDGTLNDLRIQLYGQSGVFDEVDVLNGTVTRRFEKVVLTGQEDWKYAFSGGSRAFMSPQISADGKFASSGAAAINATMSHGVAQSQDRLVNHFAQSGISYVTWATTAKWCINIEGYSGADTTVNEFKAYLAAQHAAGTPVTIVYELATPIMETVPVPALPTSINTDSNFVSSGNMSIVATTSTPASVAFDGQACTDSTVISDSELACTAPAHAAGLVDVSISLGDGRAITLANGYEYVDSPIVGAAPIGAAQSPGGQSAGIATGNYNQKTTVLGAPNTGLRWTK